MRTVGWAIGGAALLLAGGAVAQGTTIQQDFDAATASAVKGDHAAALAAWDTLERRATRSKRTRAVVLVRKSASLFALGRNDDAVAAARAGLADLPATDPTLSEDRYQAYLNLGLAGERAIDYASAADAFARAEAIAATPDDKLSALRGIAATQTFLDPTAAAAALARADALLSQPGTSPATRAIFARRRGSLLLNTGDLAGARVHGEQAVKLLGGLTSKTDINDASARGDAALALLLLGQTDRAREYLAMTGAGRLSKGQFDPGAEMNAPDCGGEAGLKPADLAVVEFTIGTDGQVALATPIYAAGGGQVALEFARVVRGWSWTPEQVAVLPAFFRNRVRIEMRCSTGYERPSVAGLIEADLATWLDGAGAPLPPPDQGAARALPARRAALAATERAGADSLAVVAQLYRLSTNNVVPREEAGALARRALAIVDVRGAPPTARLALDLRVRSSANAENWREGTLGRVLTPMLAEPAYAGDAKARSAIRLLIADQAKRNDARLLLNAVADDGALAPTDALRVGALVRLASLEHAAGDAAAARAAFGKSGLSPDQCAIVDQSPRLLGVGGTFPEKAQRWGFEGWAQTQFDIGADGRVLNERAILSYPPFVFSKAATKTMAGARYAKSFRPGGGIGCGAQTQRVRFRMPG